jgi:DNA-binding response OmpR family regulator
MDKILIVEDEEPIRILYSDELAEAGYKVITCGEGSRVMELIEQESPDVVVLDIRLGKYNGLDLLQDIRNTYYNLPVILCTAYSPYKHDIKSIAADYYVLKSSDLSELKSRIRMALEAERQLQSEGNSSESDKTKTIPVDQMRLQF